ncbi:MAG: ABC transporter substrate-binding protein, partial [Spirochaetales bacterium]|nr:ABC transporter substrate-binding protein [Spirochaetales bacterium]
SKPWPGSGAGFTYLLVQRGTTPPKGVAADRTIEVPVKSIVTMSTSYLPCLEELDVLDALAGHETFAWVTSGAVNELISSGMIQEIGSGQTVNVELLLEMDPDLIMAYGMGNEWDSHPKFEEANLPYVINAEWNETTPLGRAEWIKYIALFFNREARANAFFDNVVEEYTALSARAKTVADRPSVFAGTPYQGTWWMSGGGSFAARFYEDAGAAYLWAEDDSTGSLMLDVETVYEKAGDADFWVNTGYWNTLQDVKAADERFTEFTVFKTGAIFNNNRRMGPGGGNDYYESGPINPHKVLADLISIFHPTLLPGHELYYYKKLD